MPERPIEPPTDSVLPDPGPPTYTGAAVAGEHWSLSENRRAAVADVVSVTIIVIFLLLAIAAILGVAFL